MKKTKTVFMCNNCGNEAVSWSGRCQYCGEWNTLQEFKVQAGPKIKSESKIEVKNISQISYSEKDRLIVDIEEFDRVLGGGIVAGSLILLGGEPGIGKSTLALQLCQKIKNSFYISAEESLPQIKARAERLSKANQDMLLTSGGDLLALEQEILKAKPDLLIVDSIQTVYLSNIESSAGSMVQVRESGMFLQRLAKEYGIATLIIGHVTKEGTIAGPKIIEHLVDVVLYLEGERYQEGRILRGIKNRFGATNEIGLFVLEDSGMKEIKNPSELFLAERSNKPGSVICAVMEGRRPLLIEIQALTIKTSFGYAKRTASGFDLNRLGLLAAVIEKNTGANLSNCDIYLNVVGGIKINEPAVDLAVCAAIISSYKNKPLPQDLCIYGEVGLMGEIRNVVHLKSRQMECKKLGFQIIEKYKDLSELSRRYFKS